MFDAGWLKIYPNCFKHQTSNIKLTEEGDTADWHLPTSDSPFSHIVKKVKLWYDVERNMVF